MFTKKIYIEVSAQTSEALETKVRKLLADPAVKEWELVSEWTSPLVALPSPYKDVRIKVNGVVRIARLGHDRLHFQFASYMGKAKYQYCVPTHQIEGWQDLLAVPTTPL